MAGRSPSTRRLRSTMDSVLLHDVKNVELRLSLLLSNLEEHYGDPEFKRSVVDLLSSTLEKLDTIAGRYAAHQDGLLVKVALDLHDLLEEVTRSVRPKGSGARGRLVTDIAAGLPIVWGDAHYLTDAFTSVVANALEAAGDRGTVRISARGEKRRRKPFAVVEVEDDGPGMSADFVRERLFRPLQTTKPGGVGLGLYTARQIVTFHGGDLRVESRPGEGTRVVVSLPGDS
jgi:signal transduction histidine kinase